jgi:hypothetical protein
VNSIAPRESLLDTGPGRLFIEHLRHVGDLDASDLIRRATRAVASRPRISTARLANRSPPGVNASPAPVQVNSASSSSLRSAATCIDTPASDTPSSAAAARTEPRRTTAE